MTYQEYEKKMMEFLMKMEKPGISQKVINSIQKQMDDFSNSQPEEYKEQFMNEKTIKIAKKIMASDEEPKVYVGTYAKYNNGDLTGKWVTLSDFIDYDDFLEHCAEIHNDEDDPEFMFQDYEGFPSEYYSESGLKPELWDYLDKIQEFDKEMVDAIIEQGYDLDDVDDFMYYSDCANEADVAARYIDETGGVEELDRDTLERYFDYDAYARDMKYDMTFIEYKNGYLVKYD